MKRDFRKKRDAVLPDFSTLYYRVKGFEKKACHCAAEFFNAMSSCKVFHKKACHCVTMASDREPGIGL